MKSMKILYVFCLSLILGLNLSYAATSLDDTGNQCPTVSGDSTKGKMPNGCTFTYWVDYTPGTTTWCNGSTWHTSLGWPLAVCDVAQPTYSSYAYILPVSYYQYYYYESPYYSYHFNQCVNTATTYYTVHGTDAFGNTWMTAVNKCYSTYVIA